MNRKKRRKPSKSFIYPNSGESKTFQIKYEKKLSTFARMILSSFNTKYLYYAIDDILYSFQLDVSERDNLLAILYSPVLSLQNNFSINFFDIWIREIYISDVSKINRFLKNDSSNLEQFNYITIKLEYIKREPPKKPDPIW